MPSYKKYVIPFKRSLLLVIPATVVLTIYFPLLQSHLYISILTILDVLIILWNAPTISLYVHSKPTFPEDLIMSNDYDEETKHRYHRYYLRSMNIYLALLTVLCSNYFLYRIPKDRPYFETIGIIGGILSIYMRVTNAFCKALIRFMWYMKEYHKESRPPSPRLEGPAIIEITTI